jgi:hypothetical protein
MQYCPSCERPVAQSIGDCPHCGKALAAATGSAAAPVVPVTPVGAPAGPAPNKRLRAAAHDDDDEGDGGALLDLAFDPRDNAPSSPSSVSVPPVSVEVEAKEARGRRPAAAAAAPAAEELPPDELARAAGVSRPKNLLGAPLYAWRAFRRLAPLRAECAARDEEALRSERFRRESFALWAKSHGREMGAEAAMKPFIEAVLKANQALQGFQASHQSEFEKFRQLDGAVAEETKAAEAEKGKLAEELAAKGNAWRGTSDALARAKAKLRRMEIELRNIERVAEGKLGEGSPHHARFIEVQQARAAAAGEAAQAEGEERQAKAEADRLRGRLAEIDRTLEARREAVRNDPARRRLEDDHDRHRLALEEALSAATAQALARKVVAPDSADAQRLQSLREAEEAAKRAARVQRAALDGIDRKTIAIGFAMPAAILLVLLVLLALLR